MINQYVIIFIKEGFNMNKPIRDPFKENFDTLEEFADRISEVLQCPITIEDSNHRLLAYSTHDERTDQARIATIIGRRVPEKVINNLWKEGIIPQLLKTDDPIRVENINEIGLGNRVAISIWKNDEVLGFIWAVEVDKTLNEEELLLLKKLLPYFAINYFNFKFVNISAKNVHKSFLEAAHRTYGVKRGYHASFL